jgi:hypothetical protein
VGDEHQWLVVILFLVEKSPVNINCLFVCSLACLSVRRVKKASKTNFQEKTYLEVFQCWDFESEVCWVATVEGGGKREEVSKKHSKSIYGKRHFQKYFDVETSNLRSIF